MPCICCPLHLQYGTLYITRLQTDVIRKRNALRETCQECICPFSMLIWTVDSGQCAKKVLPWYELRPQWSSGLCEVLRSARRAASPRAHWAGKRMSQISVKRCFWNAGRLAFRLRPQGNKYVTMKAMKNSYDLQVIHNILHKNNTFYSKQNL